MLQDSPRRVTLQNKLLPIFQFVLITSLYVGEIYYVFILVDSYISQCSLKQPKFTMHFQNIEKSP